MKRIAFDKKNCLHLFIFLFISLTATAQNPSIKNVEINLSFGALHLDMEKLKLNENLDILNYFESTIDYPEGQLKLGFKFDYETKYHFALDYVVLSDLAIADLNIATYYMPRSNYGIGLGFMLTRDHIAHYETFHLDRNPHYLSVGQNMEFNRLYDMGFFIAPLYKPIDLNRFKIEISMSVGFASFLNQEMIYSLKKIQSNERIKYHYDSKIKLEPYIKPKLSLHFKLFNLNKVKIGLLANSGYYLSYKSLPLKRSIYLWTEDNVQQEVIQLPKHKFTKFNLDFGLYVKW